VNKVNSDFIKNIIKIRDEEPIDDNGHSYLICDTCNKQLADIWITHIDVPIITNISAHCPYCNKLYTIDNIKGSYYLGTTDDVVHSKVDTNITKNDDILIQKIYIKTEQR